MTRVRSVVNIVEIAMGLREYVESQMDWLNTDLFGPEKRGNHHGHGSTFQRKVATYVRLAILYFM